VLTGLGKLAALAPKPVVIRYERQRPGELIHLDTKKLGRIAGIGHGITGRTRGAVAEPCCPPPRSGKPSSSISTGAGCHTWCKRMGFVPLSSPATNKSGKTPEKGAGNLANSPAAFQISLTIR
jgi:hypothetical protein